jgi:vacuolar iron transporter family protein
MHHDKKTINFALASQREEITEYYVYSDLAKYSKQGSSNKKLLNKIAYEEKSHYNFWKKISGREVNPNKFKIWVYLLLARIFGPTFALRLMERGEDSAQKKYKPYLKIKGVSKLLADEEAHERKIIAMLKDERLDYAGSVVLGLNDALVELTGALAGMTFAIQDSKIVAIAGLVTGLAASLSMAASNFFATREDPEHTRSPMKSAVYTGVTYLAVVLILIAPYLVFSNILLSLAITLILAVSVVAAYTFYIAVAKVKPFWNQFLLMAVIAFATAAISFAFGTLLKHWFGI